MFDIKNLEALKSKVFEMKNDHCFIERERFLSSVKEEPDDPSFYAETLSRLLSSVSTPIDENDFFVGRAAEGAVEGEGECPSLVLKSKGHLTPDFEKLISRGYKGILWEISANAEKLGTNSALQYKKNAETVINAIRLYAKRYAEAALAAGKTRAYEALSKVPFEPAYDLYSALSSIWLVHMISGCYVGSRDYAFGYMDEYLYPYYLKEKENGASDDDIKLMLAGFFVKANEICGRHTHNYMQKPILSQASKQYVLLDGGRANELSSLILESAKLNCMAQPTFTVMLSDRASDGFKKDVFDAMSVLTDKMQVYNCPLMSRFMKYKGLPDDMAERPAVSACCTYDIYTHSVREEFYLPTVGVFCKTLFENEFGSKKELLDAFKRAVTDEAQHYIDDSRYPEHSWVRKMYVLDTLLLSGCNEACEYPIYATGYRVKNIFLPGIATLGDSLCALDTLVFNGDIAYSDFADMLKADFVGYDAVLDRISALKKFGNDTDADRYTTEMAELLVSAVEDCEHIESEVVVPSFYSLERDNSWAHGIPATPDGRKSGTAISENQSPVYGADRSGITALLCSVSKLPFERTGAGGLNLTFSSKTKPEILRALTEGYFAMGGMHIGISVIDKAVLRDAMEHPEKYPTLTVRLYGFSEYFISLPRWQQLAVLNRTEY